MLTHWYGNSILTKSVERKHNGRHRNGILAQLGEHLPYKQRVIGSSPIGPIKYGEIAQLARAHGSYPWCRGFESPSRYFFMPLTEYGEIAQLARAHGSYPWCRGFESPSRYYMKSSDLFQRIFCCSVDKFLIFTGK